MNQVELFLERSTEKLSPKGQIVPGEWRLGVGR